MTFVNFGIQDPPLVVDLDGTLVRTDLLIENFLTLLAASPYQAVKSLFQLRIGKAALKSHLAEHCDLDVRSLPYNQTLLAFLRSEKAKGRKIFIASASDRQLVQRLADHLDLFDGVFASDGAVNLRGEAKAEVLCAQFAETGFVYVGNDWVDFPVWRAANGVIVVNGSSRLNRSVQAEFPDATVITPREGKWTPYLRAMRPHQWAKNLLVFVPALTAHHFDASALLAGLLAFVSFSLCASSVYLLNDLLDLSNDRDHIHKRHRPFASGEADIFAAPPLIACSLLVSLAVSLFLPSHFRAVLGVYYLLTLLYSTFLKRKPSVDVLTLACLYGLRLLAGAAAVLVPVSPWLMSFGIFLFLCLALVKRWTELVERRDSGAGDPCGRGYTLSDIGVVQMMAAASGYAAVVVSCLYLSSPVVTALYGTPDCLWGIPLVLLFWINRILLRTSRGEMHGDPVIFAVTDRVSLACAGLVFLGMVASL